MMILFMNFGAGAILTAQEGARVYGLSKADENVAHFIINCRSVLPVRRCLFIVKSFTVSNN